jgi:hypothetical protein
LIASLLISRSASAVSTALPMAMGAPLSSRSVAFRPRRPEPERSAPQAMLMVSAMSAGKANLK